MVRSPVGSIPNLVNMDDVLRYSNNTFTSVLPLVWPWVGAAFAIFLISAIMFVFKKFQD